MLRTYWYRIREVGSVNPNAVQGWQTGTHNEEYVIASLKRLHGDRLISIHYEDENGEEISLYIT